MACAYILLVKQPGPECLNYISRQAMLCCGLPPPCRLLKYSNNKITSSHGMPYIGQHCAQETLIPAQCSPKHSLNPTLLHGTAGTQHYSGHSLAAQMAVGQPLPYVHDGQWIASVCASLSSRMFEIYRYHSSGKICLGESVECGPCLVAIKPAIDQWSGLRSTWKYSNPESKGMAPVSPRLGRFCSTIKHFLKMAEGAEAAIQSGPARLGAVSKLAPNGYSL